MLASLAVLALVLGGMFLRLSYNVLARCHAESMHGRSKASVLTWSFRRQRLAA